MSEKTLIGTNHSGYNNRRNIAGLPFQRYEVVRAKNVFRGPNYLWFRMTGRLNQYWLNLHWDGGRGRYALLHLFNGISLGKRPWISTFETYLPRWHAYGHGQVRWSLKYLAGAHCRRLIALSECARTIQGYFLDEFPEYRPAIMEKVEVLHPPQAIQIERASEKELPDDRIAFTLVGADFFRKGGREVLRVFDRLAREDAPVRLNIVSPMNYGDYATKTTRADLEEAMRIIAAHPRHIRHHRSLPNEEVLALFRRTHVGLLPTWADTYGYTVLEAQSCRCPVVTTDIRALPEINGPDRGWVLPVEKDLWSNAVIRTEAQRKAFSRLLEERLDATVREIVENPERITQKGDRAVEHLRLHHAPERNAAVLEAIYDDILMEAAPETGA